ncbi:MAG: four helix bundle protein [Planctomycetota bacterium]|nr:four helix bundle protein [Planctomycetota bacterium]
MSELQIANRIEDRMIEFAVRVMNLAEKLPDSSSGRHVAGQILRSGTSPAPNYAEARGAESPADFTHKLSVVLKELNETSVWLRIIARKGFFKQDRVTGLLDENRELCKIMVSSLQTMKRKAPAKGSRVASRRARESNDK